MARPTKEDQKRLTHRLPHVRCTESEAEIIRQKAIRSGLSLSEYVRRVVLDEGIVEVDAVNDNGGEEKIFDTELVYQLRAIGNNINQAVRKFHSRDEMPEELRRASDTLEKLLTAIFTSTKPG